MFTKSVLISLGITSLASIAIYFYFQQKMNKVNKKMDLMFNIIQEHQRTTQVIHTRLNNITAEDEENELESRPDNSLIDVSDTEAQNLDNNSDEETDDEGYDSNTDSEVVSDSASHQNLKISEPEESINNLLNVNQLPFNIAGADSGMPAPLVAMMTNIHLEAENLINSDRDQHNIEIEYINEPENQNLDNVVNENDENDENDDQDNNTEEETQETLSEENVKLFNEANELTENNNVNNIENETASEISTMTAQNIEKNIDIHDPKTTVAQLKALAKELNLRYRGLRKEKLVQLIQENM